MSSFSKIESINSENINLEKEKGLFKSTLKLFILNFKLFFKSSLSIFCFFIMPIIITISIGVFLPVWNGFIFTSYIALYLSSLVCFGGLFYPYNKSTFKNNIFLTKYSKKSIIFSIWITMLFFNLLTILMVVLSMILFTNLGILLTQFKFMNLNPQLSVNWWNIDWEMIFYYWFILTTIIFAFSMFAQRFLKYRKSYYLFSITYLLFNIFFGGVISISWTFNTQGEFIIIEQYSEQSKLIGALDPYLKGSPLWLVSQFLPNYHINQYAFNSILSGVEVDKSLIISEDPVAENVLFSVNNYNNSHMFNALNSSPGKVYYFVMPYVNIIFYYSLFKGHSIVF